MPLIIMCGFPLSGKSYFVEKLKAHIEQKESRNVFVVSDDNCGLKSEKQMRYNESRLEKELRAKLKSEVQTYLNDKDVVILDSLNYIKGYRYELFCLAKSRSTPHCIVHCNSDEDVCKERNGTIANSTRAYPNEILQGLIMRFEKPIGTNRWDSPLFEMNEMVDEVSIENLNNEICEAIFRKGTPVVPNKATQNPIKSSANYLQEIEQKTQSIIKFIIDMQKTFPPGTDITVPGSEREKFVLKRYQTAAELQRSRRQFVTSLIRVKNNNSFVSNSEGNIADSFVIYLNKCS